MTCYLMAIVILFISLTIPKMFIVEMRMTLTLTFEWDSAKCFYANRKPIHDLLIDGNSNVYTIRHPFQDIHNRNLHDLDL